jgi:hypothetical protein
LFRGGSSLSCKQSLPPQEREAFSLSRGFPYLVVAAGWQTRSAAQEGFSVLQTADNLKFIFQQIGIAR